MVFWVPMVLAAAQGYYSVVEREKAYRADIAARKAFGKHNLQFTKADLSASYLSLGLQRIQRRRALFQSLDQLTSTSKMRESTARVSAAESGVRGATVNAIIRDFTRIQLENEKNILDTEQYQQDQFTSDAESLRSQAHSRLLSGQMGSPQRPNYMQEFLNFTSAALGAYQYEREFNAKYPNGPGY